MMMPSEKEQYCVLCRWSLLLLQKVIGKGLHECQRLYGVLCALVEVKDFLESYTSLKNCLDILHAVFMKPTSNVPLLL